MLVVMVSGSMLRLKVRDVIKIGCRCWWVVCVVVFMRFMLWLKFFLVNFMIKMVFFVERLMMVKRLIWK